LLFLSK